MKIADNHLYHGAALIQIAEDPQFTSINSLKLKNSVIEDAYEINNGIAVNLKYGGEPNGSLKEYRFGFTQENLLQLDRINKKFNDLFLVLVCVRDREICCLEYAELTSLIQMRKNAKGEDEDQYQIIVTVPEGKKFRVYVNAPGVKKTMLGKEPMKISRRDFPKRIFAL